MTESAMTANAMGQVEFRPIRGPGWLAANVATVTARNLRRLVRVPTLIAFATVQPILFVLLFTYTFGGAIDPPGVERYIDYALPGIWVLSIAFGASQTGVAVADDLATGMIDRFRALPLARSAVLWERSLHRSRRKDLTSWMAGKLRLQKTMTNLPSESLSFLTI